VKKDRYVRDWTAEILSFVDWRTQEWTRKALKSTIELKGPQCQTGSVIFQWIAKNVAEEKWGLIWDV
jgi:hypothetical protein